MWAVERRHGGLVGGTCTEEPEGSGNVLEVDGEVFADGERVGVVNVVGGEEAGGVVEGEAGEGQVVDEDGEAVVSLEALVLAAVEGGDEGGLFVDELKEALAPSVVVGADGTE